MNFGEHIMQITLLLFGTFQSFGEQLKLSLLRGKRHRV